MPEGAAATSIFMARRVGERKNEMMTVVVQALSDQDIENLAAYYAAIEVT